ncbi:MAG TPA: serine hydrolase [Fimbriiglobus sp.]|jgi:CubicO group peptidase (beta-lactamase class C family)
MSRPAAILLLLTSFVSASRAADPLDGFDAAVAKGMKSHRCPGLGIAIVKDGKVILAKGYGVRTVGKSDAVTEKTLFAIGSISKSFTAASLAMLVDEKKLKWDDTMEMHLKDFHLPNPYLTEETTLRDCLCHRVGIGRNELIWYGSPFGREQVLEKLRKTKPQAKFRTAFLYNNILYMAAGQVIPTVTGGKSWDDFVRERLLKPLNMTSTNLSVKDLAKSPDVATPHEKVKGVAKPVDWKNADNIGPAGAINSCALDMAEYVKFQLSKGKAGGKRLVKRDVFEEMHKPQNLMPGKPLFSPDSHSNAYGFGWMLCDYKGKSVVEHGGNIDGMTAQVGMMPDEKFGVVILANLGGSLLPQALMYDLFDRFLGDPTGNRAVVTGPLMGLSEFGIKYGIEPSESARVKGTKPSLPLRKYAGSYQDDLHAPFVVTHKDDKLQIRFNGLTFDLGHWHYDTFVGTDVRGVIPRSLFTFVLGADGNVSELQYGGIGGDELRLKRKAD